MAEMHHTSAMVSIATGPTAAGKGVIPATVSQCQNQTAANVSSMETASRSRHNKLTTRDGGLMALNVGHERQLEAGEASRMLSARCKG
jgi:hypothetical protein